MYFFLTYISADMGIPSNLERDPLFSYRVILPQKSTSLDKTHVTTKEADYLTLE